MAQMPLAGGADDLDAGHAVGAVLDLGDALFRQRFPEARPARARVEFRAGLKERLPAADADVGSRVLAVVVLARKRGLGRALPRDGELLPGELGPPLLVGLGDFRRHEKTSYKDGNVQIAHASIIPSPKGVRKTLGK